MDSPAQKVLTSILDHLEDQTVFFSQKNHNAGDVINDMDLPRLQAMLTQMHKRLQEIERAQADLTGKIIDLQRENHNLWNQLEEVRCLQKLK